MVLLHDDDYVIDLVDVAVSVDGRDRQSQGGDHAEQGTYYDPAASHRFLLRFDGVYVLACATPEAARIRHKSDCAQRDKRPVAAETQGKIVRRRSRDAPR